MGRLGTMKKAELVAMAEEHGLDADGTKQDLETRIFSHLSSNEIYEKDPRYAVFLSPVKPRSRARRSPIAEKRETPPDENRVRETSADPLTPNVEPGNPRAQAAIGLSTDPTSGARESGELLSDTETPPRHEDSDESSDTRKSRPRRSSTHKQHNRRTRDLSIQSRELTWSVLRSVYDLSESMRVFASRVEFVVAFGSAIELGLLLRRLIPSSTKLISRPGTPDMIRVHTFDPAVMLSSEFWSHVIFWAMVSVVLPSITCYYVNFARISRRSSWDPLVFFIAKSILAFFVAQHGLYAYRDVYGALGSFPLVMGVSGVVLCVYEAILAG